MMVWGPWVGMASRALRRAAGLGAPSIARASTPSPAPLGLGRPLPVAAACFRERLSFEARFTPSDVARHSSSSSSAAAWDKLPEGSVYGTGSSPKSHALKRVTTRSLSRKHAEGRKITVITAYDFPSARQVDTAGADVILVGDSAGMVVHGYDTTLPLTLDELLSHCRAVARGEL